MKTFLQKHKVLMIAICAVLCLGVLSGLVLGGVIRLSARGSSFETVADAMERTGEPTDNGEPGSIPALQAVPTPSPASKEVKLSADEIKRITEAVQRRRRTVIPVETQIWKQDNNFLWTVSEPREEQRDSALAAAESLTQILFGQPYDALTGSELSRASVGIFTDPQGDRASFFRIADPNGIYILTIRESDRQLICADLLTYPDSTSVDREKDNVTIAGKLGFTVKPLRHETGTRDNEIRYAYRSDKDEYLTFTYIGDKLWRAAVFPSEQAMSECEYFLADIQYDYSTEAYPEKWTEAEPPATSEDSTVITEKKIFASLTRLYRNLSGEELDTSGLTATFYRDESGAREDCWKVTGGGFEIVISAYSGNVIRFAGSIPCKDLLDIPYEQMGGEEYEAATKVIADNMVLSYGSFVGLTEERTAEKIDVNAVYDGNYCTMDIVTKDGTWYECYFEGGVLKEIWYFANENMFWVGILTGWVADAVYVNEATGKPFIPDYRDWDGDLHVIRRDS